ncbi:hypothetical protein PanWU01x14_025930 [Parasponia andersonii]|uniref:Uncharacterized protein n=1 Tax=Parasponia andersonii TaxID=3476 RepID=A0A2P5DVW0_PARAD|nr:hypothetical protein PanWU01x14_025930 [Parasponia andersonii]
MIEQDKLRHGARCTLTLRLDEQAQTCKGRRDPLLPTQTDSPDSTNWRLTYVEFCAELTATRNRLHEVEGDLDECHQVLGNQGYMPPSSSGLVSDQSSGPTS